MVQSNPDSPRTLSSAYHYQEKRILLEIQHLLADIKRIEPKNETWCKFGDLFNDPLVEQYYEALVGTMKAAKRKGLIKFDGQFLLKGMHDHVIVSITGEAEERKPPQPKASQTNNNINENTSKISTQQQGSPYVDTNQSNDKVDIFSPAESIGSKPSTVFALEKEQPTPEKLQRLSLDSDEFYSPVTSVGSYRTIRETSPINNISPNREGIEDFKTVGSPNSQTITNLNEAICEVKSQRSDMSSKQIDNEDNTYHSKETETSYGNIRQKHSPIVSVGSKSSTTSSTKSKKKKPPKPEILMEENVRNDLLQRSQSDCSLENRSGSNSRDSKSRQSKGDDTVANVSVAHTIATAPVIGSNRSRYPFTHHNLASEKENIQVTHTSTAGVAFHSKTFSESHAERVEREVNQIMLDIRRIDPEGSPHCTFGHLFDDPEVEQYYEALVGTLKSAKRKGLIKFKGQMLLKGMHDNVQINIIE